MRRHPGLHCKKPTRVELSENELTYENPIKIKESTVNVKSIFSVTGGFPSELNKYKRQLCQKIDYENNIA